MIETHEILYSQKRTEEEDFQLSRHARQDKRTKCLRRCLLRMSQEFTKEFKTQWQGISVKYKYHLFQMPFLPIIKGCFLFLKRRLFEKKKRTPERRTEQQKPRHAKEAFLQSNRRLRHHCLFNIIMFMKRGDHFKNEERQPERVKRNKMESTYMHLSQNCQPWLKRINDKNVSSFERKKKNCTVRERLTSVSHRMYTLYRQNKRGSLQWDVLSWKSSSLRSGENLSRICRGGFDRDFSSRDILWGFFPVVGFQVKCSR